jgi:hypothetical protein
MLTNPKTLDRTGDIVKALDKIGAVLKPEEKAEVVNAFYQLIHSHHKVRVDYVKQKYASDDTMLGPRILRRRHDGYSVDEYYKGGKSNQDGHRHGLQAGKINR